MKKVTVRLRSVHLRLIELLCLCISYVQSEADMQDNSSSLASRPQVFNDFEYEKK